MVRGARARALLTAVSAAWWYGAIALFAVIHAMTWLAIAVGVRQQSASHPFPFLGGFGC